MRKHILKEVGIITVKTNDLNEDPKHNCTVWSEDKTAYYRVIPKDVRDKLSKVGNDAISDLATKLPKGMGVHINFVVLPEHDKEILEDANNAVLS